MRQYLLSVYQPDGPIPEPEVIEKIARDLDALNEELKAAGAWVFAGGLFPPSTATVLRPKGGDVLTTDGPFTEGKEHLGGFTIITAPDLRRLVTFAVRNVRRDRIGRARARLIEEDQPTQRCHRLNPPLNRR